VIDRLKPNLVEKGENTLLRLPDSHFFQNGVGDNKYPIMSPVITEKLKGEFDKVG
jgi:hypothetical protein